MHSYIFQIRTAPFSECEPLDPETILPGETVYFSYVYNVQYEERVNAIRNLVDNILPKGMFSVSQDNNLIYNGGFQMWQRSYFDGINSSANALTPDSKINPLGVIADLGQAILNPLNTSVLFEFGDGFAEKSLGIMGMLDNLTKGDVIFIGTVLGYHN